MARNQVSLVVGFLLSSGIAACADAQFLRLLGDINRGPMTTPTVSDVALGEGSATFAYFSATDPIQSNEVWRTDGTSLGTGPLGDLPAFRTNILGVAGDSIVFEAGGVLHASSGPGEFRELLPAVFIPFRNSTDSWLPHARRGDQLFFAIRAGTPQSSRVLVTDGTHAGTSVLYTSMSSSTAGITSIATTPSRVFIADSLSANFQRRLEVSDGVSPSTLVRTFPIQDGSSTPFGWLTPASDSVFFLAHNDSIRLQLWISDGTSDGTTDLTAFTASTVSLSSLVWNNGPLGAEGRLAFIGPAAANLGGPPTRLWISDGTSAGTAIAPITQTIYDHGESPLGPETPRQPVTSINGVFAFIVNAVGPTSRAIMVGDGSIAGTITLQTGSWSPTEFIGVSRGAPGEPDVAYFTAATNGFGPQLWRTDGTQAGTFMLPPPATMSVTGIRPLAMLGERFVFGVRGTNVASSVWITDGSIAGTVPLAGSEIPATGNAGSSPSFFTSFSDRVTFLASSNTTGLERFAATADASSAVLCEETAPGTASNSPSSLVSTSSHLFYRGQRSIVVDGVQRNTFIVRATTDPLLAGEFVYQSPPDGIDVTSMTRFGNSIVFSGNADPANVSSTTLWISDGTPAGTRPIVSAGAARPVGVAAVLGEWDGRMYFYSRRQNASTISLWSTDGTEVGTRWIADMLTGLSILSPTALARQERLYFTAFDANESVRLWSTDGVTAGIVDPSVQVQSGSLVLFEGRVHFAGTQAGNQADLWRTDAAGTALEPVVTVSTTGTGSISGLTRAQTPTGERLFFSANVGTGPEPWISDGTQDGTVPLVDLWPGALGSSPLGYSVVSGGVIFSARTPAFGHELWFSDGTTAGTRLLVDINPGPESSNPGASVIVGNVASIAAYRPDVGREPWAVLLTPCAGDFNTDGFVNSADFFAFVNEFFALAPSADVNDDGVVTSQDFFDFLAGFFAGC